MYHEQIYNLSCSRLQTDTDIREWYKTHSNLYKLITHTTSKLTQDASNCLDLSNGRFPTRDCHSRCKLESKHLLESSTYRTNQAQALPCTTLALSVMWSIFQSLRNVPAYLWSRKDNFLIYEHPFTGIGMGFCFGALFLTVVKSRLWVNVKFEVDGIGSNLSSAKHINVQTSKQVIQEMHIIASVTCQFHSGQPTTAFIQRYILSILR